MRLVLGFAAFASLVALPRIAAAQDLAPPPPIDQSSPSSSPSPQSPGDTSGAPQQSTPAAEQQSQSLEQQEKEDSGRPLEWVWLNAEAGGSYINMEQFNSTTFAIQKSSSGGPMLGVGAGIRLLVFTLGVRARVHEMSAFNLWQINGEFGFHIPIKNWDPYIAVHGGYAFVGTLSADSLNAATGSSANDVSIHGFNAGLSLGADYYFTPLFSLGLDITADALFLHRPPTPLPPGLTPAEQQQLLNSSPQAAQLYQNSGDSAGFGLVGSLHLGLHF